MAGYATARLSEIAVKIGPGSGKYTLEAIRKMKKTICFDVPKEFMKIAKDRLSQYIAQGRVEFKLSEL